MPDELHNYIARGGVDLCWCGAKYWEQDRCIDCNTHILDSVPAEV